ncbi:MFS transporter [Synechococcus sp. CS-205]|uniref:MFS transporter n=1 Tax=Synechococcus sp. CS-205 TaxID=2847984 RepID=UPI00223AF0F5|nr:MFS transporter [Synechococcus sp. CS-205]
MAAKSQSLEALIEAGPVSRMQWLLWSLASAGKLFEGLIIFSGGITLPLIAETFALSTRAQGLVSAATLMGILLGALLLGALADRFGRKSVFVGEMLVLVAALLLVGLSPGPGWLLAGLVLAGMALGADYPTAHLVLSESFPSVLRGRLVLAAFSFQALGALLGTAVAASALQRWPAAETWRVLYLMPAGAVLLLALARLLLPESTPWLISQGRHQEAEFQLRRLLNRQDLDLRPIPATDRSPPRERISGPGSGPMDDRRWWRPLGSGQQRALILSAIPWFLQDITTYGVGIFTPLLLAPASDLGSRLFAARGAVLVNGAFLLGIAAAILLTDRLGRIRLQMAGFLGCAGSLLLAASGSHPTPGSPLGHWSLMVGGLALFQFMTNLGPNSQTYLLAGEVFPTAIRGQGAGLAAAAGKVGAVLTAFGFPLLLNRWGSEQLLMLLTIPCLAGALITWLFQIETAGHGPAGCSRAGHEKRRGAQPPSQPEDSDDGNVVIGRGATDQ